MRCIGSFLLRYITERPSFDEKKHSSALCFCQAVEDFLQKCRILLFLQIISFFVAELAAFVKDGVERAAVVSFLAIGRIFFAAGIHNICTDLLRYLYLRYCSVCEFVLYCHCFVLSAGGQSGQDRKTGRNQSAPTRTQKERNKVKGTDYATPAESSAYVAISISCLDAHSDFDIIFLSPKRAWLIKLFFHYTERSWMFCRGILTKLFLSR